MEGIGDDRRHVKLFYVAEFLRSQSEFEDSEEYRPSLEPGKAEGSRPRKPELHSVEIEWLWDISRTTRFIISC
jgi:hypothetical protein